MQTEEHLSKSERKHRNQRRIIIQSARKLFESKSYDDVSMEDIADAAAVSKQTLYNYFSNKDSIYFGVGVEGFIGSLDGTEETFLKSTTGKEQVLKLSEDYFKALMQFPLGTDISRRFMTDQEINALVERIIRKKAKGKPKQERKKKSMEDVIAEYMEQVWRYQGYWNNAINGGIKDGSITSTLSVDQLSLYIMTLISGVVDHMQMRRIPFEQVKLDDHKTREITLGVVESLLRK